MSQDLSPLAKPQKPELLYELRALIHAVRSRVATAVNAELTLLHWRIGKRLLADNLHQGRAKYGQHILASLAQELAAEFGKGFSYSALTRMVRFAELFPDERGRETDSLPHSFAIAPPLLPLCVSASLRETSSAFSPPR